MKQALALLWTMEHITCVSKPIFDRVETDEKLEVEQHCCQTVQLVSKPEVGKPDIVKWCCENPKLKHKHKVLPLTDPDIILDINALRLMS